MTMANLPNFALKEKTLQRKDSISHLGISFDPYIIQMSCQTPRTHGMAWINDNGMYDCGGIEAEAVGNAIWSIGSTCDIYVDRRALTAGQTILTARTHTE